MKSRLNTNKKPANNRLYLIIALLIVLSGVVMIFLLSTGGESPETDTKVVHKSIRVTDPTKAKEEAREARVTTTKVKKADSSVAKVTLKKPKAAVVAKAAPVKTTSKTTRSVQTATPSGRGLWAIHVASFQGEKYAKRLERAIDRVGYNSYITSFVKDNVNWHRVRVGFFSTKEDASKTAAIISKRFKQPGAWIVKPPKDEIEKNKI